MIEEYVPSWVLDYLAPIVLVVGGVMALVIAITYVRDKESASYKICVLLGVILGILIAVLAVIEGFKTDMFTKILIVVAAFTLIIRPVRDIHISVIVGLMVMILVYVALGSLNGVMIADKIDLTPLSQGWVRVGIAFVAGAIVYGLLNFAEALVKLFGKILNLWPVLFVLGIVCVIEGICIYMGYGSLYDLISGIKWNSDQAIILLM